METIIFWCIAGAFLLAVMLRDLVVRLTFEKKETARLESVFGQKPTPVRGERKAHLNGYYKAHQSGRGIDDITWNDLEMDELFADLNFTHSAIGEEYLYYLLRECSGTCEDLERMEKYLEALAANPSQRAKIEYIMETLGYTEKYSIYEYLAHLDILGQRSNWKHYLMDAFLVACICLIPFQTGVGVAGAVLALICNIATYFREKKELEPYIISFVFVLRMVEGARKMASLEYEWMQESSAKLKKLEQTLRAMKRGFFVVEHGAQPISGGNPLEIVMDYLKMSFHVDIILFNRLYRFLDRNKDSVDEMIGVMGELDAFAAVAAYRHSLKGEWCVPRFLSSDKPQLRFEDGYHPRISQPVKNSIDAKNGVLITGSNASGKSSFLKMTAVNAILAQSIHTVCAASYEGNLFQIYSSMSLRDDLNSGDSYFMVEIKAIKRILMPKENDRPVLCFVDEVLRGTNTIERIAASSQILRCLNQQNRLCFAATHDLELTYLLEKEYDNYHFDEEIAGDDVVFKYLLLPGRATSRNAILLLKQMGYEDSLVQQAGWMAQTFERTGKWSMPLDDSRADCYT